MKNKIRVRSGNPYNGGRLGPSDFFTPGRHTKIIFEDGIKVVVISSETVIVSNKGFCAVKGNKHDIIICLSENVNGREVLYKSPNILEKELYNE